MKMKNKACIIAPFLLVVLLLLAGGLYWYKSFQDKFAAPRKDAPIVQFKVSKENTLMAVTGNLAYYGLVKDGEALKYALLHTKDATPGNENSLRIGQNTIDAESIYEISPSMSAWQIADILLNKGKYCGNRCESFVFKPELLPGGDIAPTWEEQMKTKYSWVKNYDDCLKAIGHDGGQVTSEEASKRTGHPRVCNTADGRYFVQGQEGWSDYPPYP